MRKGLQILFMVFFIQLIASCCKDVEFFDYSIMAISEANLFITEEENLEMTLFAEDIEYMTAISNFGFSETYAINCDEGWGGMKHPITEITISSPLDFDNSHAANVSLSDIFEYHHFLENGEFEYRKLNELKDYSSANLSLRLIHRPISNLTHIFEVKVIKANGDQIELTSNEIT